jgi:hypothetical protein
MKAKGNLTVSALFLALTRQSLGEEDDLDSFQRLGAGKMFLFSASNQTGGNKKNAGEEEKEEEETEAIVGSEVEHGVTLLMLKYSSDYCATQTVHHLIICNKSSNTILLFSVFHYSKFSNVPAYFVDQDSPVCIATHYGLDCPGIESRWGEFFRTCPDRPWVRPSLFSIGYLLFPGVGGGGEG